MTGKYVFNLCGECLEGFTIGSRVYCSIDGRFHPPVGGDGCKEFNPKRLIITSWGGILEFLQNYKI